MNTNLTQKAHEVILQFAVEGEVVSLQPYGNGHINDTFLAVFGDEKRYILQRINQIVFKKPLEVLENISNVTSHIAKQIAKRGGDVDREVLKLFKTKAGEICHTDSQGEYWRLYAFVEDTVSYELPDTEDLFENSGRAFGEFQQLLADFEASTLHETIIDFHNTQARCNQLDTAIANADKARVELAKAEIAFAKERYDEAKTLRKMQLEGKLPLRVTHNDTKLNNVLLDKTTGKPVCVIDLDTVMPGLSCYDFGDSIRFGASTSSEDETDLTKCNLDLGMFKAFSKGYLFYAGKSMTELERTTLPLGAKLMTYECGIRFLADYLNGNIYFKTTFDEHNLVRCRTQFKLVSDMEQKWDQMTEIINSL